MQIASKPDKSRVRATALIFVVLCVCLILTGSLGEILIRFAFRRSMDFDMEMWKYATQIKVRSEDPRVVHEHRTNGILDGGRDHHQ
jgi:hypothetical protein